jgi:hypothetical protein
MLFFKALHALVQLLAGDTQESLLQCQFHMDVSQRFLDLSQLASELEAFAYFMSFFHAYDLTILSAAKLPHPSQDGATAFDLVLALHREGTRLTRFNLSYALQFETFAITNHFHWHLEFFIQKYQSISGRDPRA